MLWYSVLNWLSAFFGRSCPQVAYGFSFLRLCYFAHSHLGEWNITSVVILLASQIGHYSEHEIPSS